MEGAIVVLGEMTGTGGSGVPVLAPIASMLAIIQESRAAMGRRYSPLSRCQ